jgi:hypothetical protein
MAANDYESLMADDFDTHEDLQVWLLILGNELYPGERLTQ